MNRSVLFRSRIGFDFGCMTDVVDQIRKIHILEYCILVSPKVLNPTI